MMEIAFRTKALRTVCLSEEAMDELYGAGGGASLRRRLADMRAGECLGDVPLLMETSLLSVHDDEATIAVGNGLMMVVKANHQRLPRLKGGGIDWPSVSRVLVQRIEHVHG